MLRFGLCQTRFDCETTRRIHYLNERTVTVAATVEADNLVRYGWSTVCLLGWSTRVGTKGGIRLK